MESKKQYIVPQLTITTYKSELGFANSLIETMTFWSVDDATSEQVDDYIQHDIWNDGTSFWN